MYLITIFPQPISLRYFTNPSHYDNSPNHLFTVFHQPISLRYFTKQSTFDTSPIHLTCFSTPSIASPHSSAAYDRLSSREAVCYPTWSLHQHPEDQTFTNEEQIERGNHSLELSCSTSSQSHCSILQQQK